ncbi:MAG: cold shock domain-containing protein, partial [Eubacterium sp.]|nr:cold shock domain-containing protein [Eubacterium sp.]
HKCQRHYNRFAGIYHLNDSMWTIIRKLPRFWMTTLQIDSVWQFPGAVIGKFKKYEGILENYALDKGYGFVNTDNKRVFVHISKVVSGSLKNGSRITFEIEETKKGYQAVNIVAE